MKQIARLAVWEARVSNMNQVESELRFQKSLATTTMSPVISTQTEDKHEKTVAARKRMQQWSMIDDGAFCPAGQTVPILPPGAYELKYSDQFGHYLSAFDMNTTKLLRFNDSVADAVINEITSFWSRRDLYRQFNTPFKRGILLWGPPGGGKSSIVRILANDIITNHNGVVLQWDNAYRFETSYELIRSVEQDKPIIVIMEDLDSILEYEEREVTNILDGIKRYENIVFLATTNYPDRLSQRIVNRPGRFDKKFEIGSLDAANRRTLISSIVPGNLLATIDLDRWVQDTEGMQIAHIKELVIAVMVIGDDYETTVSLLKTINGVNS